MSDIALITDGDRLDAGPCLDALVCWKVLGWRWFGIGNVAVLVPRMWEPDSWWVPLPDGPPHALKREGIDGIFFWDSARGGHTMPDIPALSTDIAAAWRVVETLNAGDRRVELLTMAGREWKCNAWGTRAGWNTLASAVHEYPAVAICRAALKAVSS